MVSLLVGLLVLAFFVYILKVILDLLPFPAGVKNAVWLIVAFIVLVAVLQQLGFLAGIPLLR